MISIIAAVDANGVFGIDNCLPWQYHHERIRIDMRRFKALTEGNAIVMGKETFISLGKPLPKRENIVVSTTLKDPDDGGYMVASSLQHAINMAKNLFPRMNIFLIGGKRIWLEGIETFADGAFITEVGRTYSAPETAQLHSLPVLRDLGGDTPFEEDKREIETDPDTGIVCNFVHYVRNAQNQPK